MQLNSKGQSLIEYLIIVALVAIGSIAVVRSMGHTVYVRFANITNALQNNHTEVQPDALTPDEYQKKGLDNFFRGGN